MGSYGVGEFGKADGPDFVLTTPSGRSALVYLFSVLVHSQLLPYRYLTHGHLSLRLREAFILHWERGRKKERLK